MTAWYEAAMLAVASSLVGGVVGALATAFVLERHFRSMRLPTRIVRAVRAVEIPTRSPADAVLDSPVERRLRGIDGGKKEGSS